MLTRIGRIRLMIKILGFHGKAYTRAEYIYLHGRDWS